MDLQKSLDPREYNKQLKHYYSSSRIDAHLMFPLFPENRKPIPKSLVVKTFQKCNASFFKFYASKLTINISRYGVMLNFLCYFVMFNAMKTDSKLTLHHMEIFFII